MGPRGQKDNPPSEKYRGRHTQRKDQGLGGIDNICYPLAQYKPPRAGATCKGRRRSPAHQVPALHQLGKQTSKIAKKKKNQSGIHWTKKIRENYSWPMEGHFFLEQMVRVGLLLEVPNS